MSELIAVTQRVQIIESIGERRDALSQEWTALADQCGFIPLLLPNHRTTVSRMLECFPVDGIILTGGNDLASYGGDAAERDEVESYLISVAIEKRLPLLGVCRGMQMILTYFGTELHRVDGHVRVEHMLDDGDTVNSYHSWAALECSFPLTAFARTADGVIEAVEHEKYPWIKGIMWHPERYRPMRERDIEFVKEVFSL